MKSCRSNSFVVVFFRSQTKARAGQEPQRTSNRFWSLSTKKRLVVNAAKAVFASELDVFVIHPTLAVFAVCL